MFTAFIYKIAFPLPLENDSLNLLHIQMEKAYFTLQLEKMDSLARKFLEIDSTFYSALAFQAFRKWPFDLDKLRITKKYALRDTAIQRMIFDGDYSCWIEKDSIKANKIYTEVCNRYPNSKITAWLAVMSNIWIKDYPTVVWYFKRSLEIDSKLYYAHLDMGDAYLQSRQYKKAIENFKILLNHFPSQLVIHKYIGDAYMGLNDSTKAKENYRLVDSLKMVNKK